MKQDDACPAGCKAGKCQPNIISGGYICTECDTGLILLSNGKCGCSRGDYYDYESTSCEACPMNHYCPGGTYAPAPAGEEPSPKKVSCVRKDDQGNTIESTVNLITTGWRKKSIYGCGKQVVRHVSTLIIISNQSYLDPFFCSKPALPVRSACPTLKCGPTLNAAALLLLLLLLLPCHAVNAPGYKFTWNVATSQPGAEKCQANTYSPGKEKQRGCVSCPPGFITVGDGKSSLTDCGEFV